MCLALGLCAGELAVATAGWLLAYALFLDRGSVRQRVVSLVPSATIVLGWALWYQVGGFGARGSGYYDDPMGNPVGFVLNCAQHIPRLLLGQWTPIPAELSAGPGMLTLSVCVTIALCVLLGPLVRRNPAARFFALGALLSLLPIAATGPMNRLLFFVGLGSMGLLSLGLAQLFAYASRASRPRSGRLLAIAFAGLLLVIHVALAPLGGLAMIESQARVGSAHAAAMSSVPHDAAIADQDLWLLNPPDYPYAAMSVAPYKRMQGLPVARRLRALVAANTALELLRVSANTLQVTLSPGLFTDPFSRYFRARQVAFHAGERITVPGLSIQIEALNQAGDPDRIRYQFEHPLEHPSLRWLEWRDGRYRPWQPPAIGAATHVAAPGSLFQ